MASPFFPPKPNSFILGITHRFGAFLAQLLYQLRLQVSEADLAPLRQLRHQRVIYMVNHPTFHDPILVMLLSARLGKGFYYLASIEQFSGILGWYFQRIGGYSIRRGQGDRPSMRQTLELLTKPDTHLVIFPEGGCSFQNDTVMPFRPGAIQLAFQTMQRAVKQGDALYDCYVVPLALKYQYIDNPDPLVQQTLVRLEEKLSLTPAPRASNYERLRAIAVKVLTQIEAEYGVMWQGPETDLTHRVESLRQAILLACETALGLETNLQTPRRERTYQIEAVLDRRTVEPKTLSRELITRSIFRLLNFNAIYDGYVAEVRSPERFLDTLTRFEREVFQVDRPPVKGARMVKLGVGEILNLKEHFAEYEGDRAATIERLTQHIQTQVQRQVDRLSRPTSE